MKGIEQTGWSGRTAVGAVAACLALACAVLLSLQYSPPFQELGRDSGVFLYAGWQIVEGKLPYVDFWDHKPPGTYLINALGLATGMGRWGVWLVETGLFAAGVTLLCVGLWRRMGLFAALVGIAFAILASRNGAFIQGGNLTEGYVNSMVMLLLGGLLLESGRSIAWIAMGVVAAAIFFTKQSCIGAPLAVGLVLIWTGLVRRRAPFGRFLAAYCVGAVGTTVLAVAAMAMLGILREFWDANFVFSRIYVAEKAFPGSIGHQVTAAEALNSQGLVCTSALALVGGCLFRLRLPGALGVGSAQRNLVAVLLIAIPIEIWTICLPGTYFGHYYLALLPLIGLGFALWAGAGAAVASRLLGQQAVLAKLLVGGLLPVCLCAASMSGPLALFPLKADEKTKTKSAFGFERFQEDPDLMEYLSKDPGRPLLFWGAEAKWNFLSRRPAPTRYVYNYPLCYPKYDQARRMAELLADLKKHPDALIIDTEYYTFNSLEQDRGNPLPGIAAPIPPELLKPLRNYIAENYRQDRIFPNSWNWVAYVPRQHTVAEGIGDVIRRIKNLKWR